MSFGVEIKLTLPKDGTFRNKKWLDSIRVAQKKTAQKELKGLFEQTVHGWSAEKKPRFAYKQEVTQDHVSIFMYPEGKGADIWELVSKGSPPHPIYPKREGGLLRFRPGYRAATTPGTLMSRRAYRSGAYVSVPRVRVDGTDHPGFEARNFPEMIEDEFFHTFVDKMQDAVNDAARGW